MPQATGSISPTTPPIPKGIPPKPEDHDFEKPVGWLLGRQLIASLKFIFLYTAFKGKLDARDWMKAEVIPRRNSGPDVDPFWVIENGAVSKDEFWFDYMADSGDGQKAVYSVAFLSMSDLAVSESPQVNQPLQFVKDPNAVESGQMLLPRGTFLFVGGDTSYHISDYATLASRFQNPFWWAFKDLWGSASVMGKPRLLFGIPGNHDYYDSLDGFNRQFRRPSTPDKVIPGQRSPLLMLPTFRRQQSASYIALRLPFDWWFWGLDTEEGQIDFRQLEFFKKLHQKYNPEKLIVATPEPTISFGKFAKEDESQAKTFKAIGLKRPFLETPEPVAAGTCRVDLSGDIHHYARYFGPPRGSNASANYASVMSGGGGAFLHPSQTNVHEVQQQALYPAEATSRKHTANELFKISNIINGGFVWLFGLLMAFAICFAAYLPQSSKDAVDSFPPFVALGISSGLEMTADEPPTVYVQPMNRNPWRPVGVNTFEHRLWTFSIVVSVGLLAAALFYSIKLFKEEYDPSGTMPKKKITSGQRALLWILVSIAFSVLAFGIWGFHTYEPSLTRYGRSALIFAAVIWAILAVIIKVRYSARLFEDSYGENIEWWHYWPIWLLAIMTVLELGASLWFFGKHEAAYLISDVVQLCILVLGGGAISILALLVGGGLKKGAGKVGFLLLGISHALLQLTVPFLLVRRGHLIWAPLAALVLVFVFKFVGRYFAGLKNGWPLAAAWIVFGALLLLVPFIFQASTVNMPESRWLILVLCVYAGVIGALMSCVLFGWYLAVALAFNGHNNEAGGAARIEGFKHLIRFRLDSNSLTGYVIAVDEAKTDGPSLKPKLVDVFRISNQSTS
jgi:hypothetical protein